MKIFMASVNYKNSSINQREKLSFDKEKISEIIKKICLIDGIFGCIIISTCNRTEIYISSAIDLQVDKLLLDVADIQNFQGQFEKKQSVDAVYHIIQLACGLKSQIIGEGQIVSQINFALQISRENNCTDSILETLFRIAVSAGKFALTNAKLSNIPLSSAYAAVELIKQKFGNISDKKCVVIGNGKMGQIVQELLIKSGAKVLVTLRSYKSGNNEVIKGCETINYSDRYEFIESADFVITATRSPHYTITYDKLKKLKNKPLIIIDLAIPRDVEPDVSNICQTYNIDELGFKTQINEDERIIVDNIVEKFVDKFYRWKNYKLSLNDMDSIKKIISQRIVKSGNFDKNDEELIALTVKKTTDMIFGGFNNAIPPKNVQACRKKIEERSRL